MLESDVLQELWQVASEVDPSVFSTVAATWTVAPTGAVIEFGSIVRPATSGQIEHDPPQVPAMGSKTAASMMNPPALAFASSTRAVPKLVVGGMTLPSSSGLAAMRISFKSTIAVAPGAT